MSTDKNINDILSSVLENKELMSKISGIVSENKSENKEDVLPDIVSAISDAINTDKEEKEETKDTGSAKSEESAKETSSILSRVRGNHESVALLKAIKPFLSKERCELVDNILKFEQLTSLIELVR